MHPLQLPRDKDTGELHCGLFPQLANLNPEFVKILNTMVRYQHNQRYKDANSALAALHRYLYIYQIPTAIQPPANGFLQRIFGFFQRLFVGETPDNSVAPTMINPKTVPQVDNSKQQQQQIETKETSFPPIEQPEGQVSLQSTLYIERPPIEIDCYEAILQPGALIRIKAPRQMGKTSLLTRILDYGNQRGYQTAYLNLQSADAEFFTSLDKFLQWFCGCVAQELNLQDVIDHRAIANSKTTKPFC